MSSQMLEVRHLRLVRALVEEGGPTRAAARLHLSQSAVSHQLAELEGRLGVPLFARVRRRLHLTPAGARLLDTARSVLTQLARTERELHRTSARDRAVIRVAVECFTAYHWLPEVIAEMATAGTAVDVHVVLEATREPVAALLRGALDLALVSSPVRDRQLLTRPLFEDEWTVIVAPGHPLAARPFLSAIELGSETLFAHDAPRADVERLRDLISAERAVMPRIVPVPLTDTLVDLVKAGLGIAIVSRWAVAPAEARGDVVTRRLTRRGLAERWSAVYRRDSEARLPLARFAELVVAAAPVPRAPHAGGRSARR